MHDRGQTHYSASGDAAKSVPRASCDTDNEEGVLEHRQPHRRSPIQ